MNWAKHNLKENHNIVSVAAWQEFDWLRQGFSLRSAGNIAFGFGDATAARNTVCAELEVDPGSWTGMQQVHSNHIEVVDLQDVGKGSHDFESAFVATDGLISDQPDALLAVVVADCVPLLFVDPVTKTVAVAHAGRRGTELGIVKMTFKRLLKRGSDVSDIQVVIGPSIGPCCYVFDGQPLDLWTINEQQLREAGAQTIIRTDLCTKHTDYFFSHQRDPEAGRFAGLIGTV